MLSSTRSSETAIVFWSHCPRLLYGYGELRHFCWLRRQPHPSQPLQNVPQRSHRVHLAPSLPFLLGPRRTCLTWKACCHSLWRPMPRLPGFQVVPFLRNNSADLRHFYCSDVVLNQSCDCR